MKAIVFDEFGAADVLKIDEVPEPVLRPHDLLVRTRAAGVNRADLTHCRGGYGRPDFGDSTIMGLEIAGDVIALGEAVQGFAVGDRVMGIVGGGAYAEVSRIDYRMAMPMPDSLDYVQAAAMTEVFVTAHEALIHLANCRSARRCSSMRGPAASGARPCNWRMRSAQRCWRRRRPRPTIWCAS